MYSLANVSLVLPVGESQLAGLCERCSSGTWVTEKVACGTFGGRPWDWFSVLGFAVGVLLALGAPLCHESCISEFDQGLFEAGWAGFLANVSCVLSASFLASLASFHTAEPKGSTCKAPGLGAERLLDLPPCGRVRAIPALGFWGLGRAHPRVCSSPCASACRRPITDA